MEKRLKVSGSGDRRTTRNWEAPRIMELVFHNIQTVKKLPFVCRSWREKRVSKTKNWKAMDPLVLGLIFACIPSDTMVRTVPLVCRSWAKSLDWPDAWTKIDVREWIRGGNHSNTATVDGLINSSHFFLISLKVVGIDDATFLRAYCSGRMLKVLKMPSSQVRDRSVMLCERFLFPNLTTLDISCCKKITSKGIEMFGKHAKRLVKLRRNMARSNSNEFVRVNNESEAMAVAHSMPALQHLELRFGFFSHRGLDLILTNCKALGYLDVHGCWNVKLDEKIKERCDKIFSFRGPNDAGKGKMKTDED